MRFVRGVAHWVVCFQQFVSSPPAPSFRLLRATAVPAELGADAHSRCICSAALHPVASGDRHPFIGPFVFNAKVENKNVPTNGATRKTNMKTKNTSTQVSNKPAHEIRISGIRASIWKNDTEKGPRYNTTFERSYKDGEVWKTSDSFGRDDLLLLAHIATEAFRWIAQQPTK